MEWGKQSYSTGETFVKVRDPQGTASTLYHQWGSSKTIIAYDRRSGMTETLLSLGGGAHGKTTIRRGQKQGDLKYVELLAPIATYKF